MPYTVIASGICKSFGGHLVLDHVELKIETRSVCALLGPNGAGKTTMVRILGTLLRPDAGTARVAGYDLVREPFAVKRSISLTGQYAAIDDRLTGRENLEMMAQLLHLPRRSARARAAELLADFDLREVSHRRVGTYSGGLKRRLDLAISMIVPPQLLFLDEPSTGLDPRTREQLWGIVAHLVSEGVTVLLTTQYLEEADQLADTIVVLDHGRVVARGTPNELKSTVGSEVVRLQFADAEVHQRALRLLAAVASDARSHSIEVATDGSATEVRNMLDRLAAAGAPALKVSVHRPSLDDVFLSLTASGRGEVA
jgi:ABC-2 type transport system ATP-binding protein